jgi:hypothetical protein
LIYSSEVNFVPKDIFAFSMKAKPEWIQQILN